MMGRDTQSRTRHREGQTYWVRFYYPASEAYTRVGDIHPLTTSLLINVEAGPHDASA